MKKTNAIIAPSIFMTLLLCLLLTGCSGKSNAVTETNAAQYSKAGYGDIGLEEAASYDGMVSMDVAAPDEAAGEMAEETGLTSPSAMENPAAIGRKLIRNASLQVETTEFDNLLSGISGMVTQLGGYLEESNISGQSIADSSMNQRYAYMIARVPSDKMDQFITQIAAQGNIISKSESTQDVTLEYSDIESRKKSLAIEQERLWALLEKADTLESVIALEARLSEIRYELESFESQLRLYDNQVDYSTISIDIREVKVFTPTTPDSALTRIQKGFRRNLSNVGIFLTNFVIWFISSIPTLILFICICGILFLVIRLISRKVSKHRDTSKKSRQKQIISTPADSVLPKDGSVPPLKNQENQGSEQTDSNDQQ